MTDAAHAGFVEAEREHQDAWYRRAIAERFFEHEGFDRLIAWNLAALGRSVPISVGMRVLSIGCGLGDYELALAPRVGHVIAFDLSEVAVEEARRRAAAAGVTNVEFQRAGTGDITLEPGAFDLVYAMGVLHHLEPPARSRLFRDVRGWLCPGGWFYARDPDGSSPLRRWFEPACRRRSRVHSPTEAALIPDVIVRELIEAGFEPPAVRGTEVIAGPLPWLLRAAPGWLWSGIFGVDRICLATPGLRRLASQFSVAARTGQG